MNTEEENIEFSEKELEMLNKLVNGEDILDIFNTTEDCGVEKVVNCMFDLDDVSFKIKKSRRFTYIQNHDPEPFIWYEVELSNGYVNKRSNGRDFLEVICECAKNLRKMKKPLDEIVEKADLFETVAKETLA